MLFALTVVGVVERAKLFQHAKQIRITRGGERSVTA
jgi:hypothetical protein